MNRISILLACMALHGLPMMAQTPKLSTIRPTAPGPATEAGTFALKSGGRLRIKNPNGDIKISTWDKDEVHLVANFTPDGHGDHLRIKAHSSKKSLILNILSPKERRNRSGSCALELRVPAKLAMEIKSGNGGMAVSGTTGRIHAKTFNGGITANGAIKEIFAKTFNGGITINGDVKKIYAKTFNGGITIGEASGNINAKTFNGAIALDNASGRIKAFALNGGVSGSIGDVDGLLDLATYIGNINIKLLNPSGSLVASAEDHGRIEIKTPMASDVKIQKRPKETIVKARLGSGSAKISLKTIEGTIVVD